MKYFMDKSIYGEKVFIYSMCGFHSQYVKDAYSLVVPGFIEISLQEVLCFEVMYS
jgi:hypothetical protein